MHNPTYTPQPHHTGKYLHGLYKSETELAIESITKSELINSLEKSLPALPLDTITNWDGHELVKSQFGWQLYDEGQQGLNKSDDYDIEKGRPGMPIGAHATWGGKDYLKTAQGWKPVGKHRGAVKSNHDLIHANTSDKDHAAMVHDAGNMDEAAWTAKHGENLHGKYKAVHDYLHKQKEAKDSSIIGKTKSGKDIHDTFEHDGHKGFSAEDHGDAKDAHIAAWKNKGEPLPFHDNKLHVDNASKHNKQKAVKEPAKEENNHGIEVGKDYGHDLDGKVTVTKVEKNTGDKSDKISHHVTYKDSTGKETTQGVNGFKESTKAGHQDSALARKMKEDTVENYDRYKMTINHNGKPKEVEIEVIGEKDGKKIVRLHKKYSDTLPDGKSFTVSNEDLAKHGQQTYKYKKEDFELPEDSPFRKKEDPAYTVKDETRPFQGNKDAKWVRVSHVDDKGVTRISGVAVDVHGSRDKAIEHAKKSIQAEKDKEAVDPAIVSRTKSGKAIYANKMADAEEYKNFTAEDHKDADSHHNNIRVKFNMTESAANRKLELQHSHSQAAKKKDDGHKTLEDWYKDKGEDIRNLPFVPSRSDERLLVQKELPIVQDLLKFKKIVQKTDYNKAIKEGKLTESEAKNIIESAGLNPAEHIKSENSQDPIHAAISQYGWEARKTAGGYELHNRNGKKVATVEVKGGKYKFLDNSGTKLMSGAGDLAASAEKLITQYWYASKNK